MVVHQRLALAILVLGLAGGLWAAVNVVRGRVSPGLRAYLFLTEGLIVAQSLAGLGLWLAGRRPHESLHYIYGPAVLLALPVALALRGREGTRAEAVALLGGSVAVFLLGIRAVATGGA